VATGKELQALLPYRINPSHKKVEGGGTGASHSTRRVSWLWNIILEPHVVFSDNVI
jgi:hypothetical protein